MLSLPLVTLGLALGARAAQQPTPGSFVETGNTLVSAMMMFVGNAEKVYILDKAETNEAQINGHSAWGSVYDLASNKADAIDVYSNTFCAAGMHLPNGSYITFGGNGAIGPGGNAGSVPAPGARSGFDDIIKDYDGTAAMRILTPCSGSNSDLLSKAECGWWEDANVLAMKEHRWYASVEPLGDGSIVIIGGYSNGGYINRNYPNTDPTYEGGAAIPTFEWYPPKEGNPVLMDFMTKTSGLNSYAHAFTMPSGKMFVQANLSSIIWDPINNVETALPDMPKGVVRVYPASGGAAMLPLTPANNYNPTILFCGGNDMPEYNYGNYAQPFVDTWNVPASKDCQRITPEPTDGSAPQYVQDDDMLDSRTMGQLIALPDGTLLVLNGAKNGTAGYSNGTLTTPNINDMPYWMGLASGPVLTPSIYNPDAPAGQRWSSTGLQASKIPRLYHSGALLLPDGSVFVAGSNPNVDVNTTTTYPTTYQSEIFYPPYYSSNRPVPSGVPQTLSYGGKSFDITIPASSYNGDSNKAAANTKIMVIRQGFTTHGMNMGQRALQLNNTYTVNDDGTIIYHVSQMPPNSNIFQPGPAFLYVTINGVPSVGSHVIIGSGKIETQPTSPVDTLPANVLAEAARGTGSQDNFSTRENAASSLSVSGMTGLFIGAAAAVVALL